MPKKIPASLLKKIRGRSARIGVIGLGYVGLPLAVEFAKRGYAVVGIDVDPARVKALRAGRSYIPDVPQREIAQRVRQGRFTATTDYSVLKKLDAVMICVPTPLRKTREPDISYIVAASEALAKHLHRYQVIVLESTTYPGTTEELILPMLEKTGLKVGQDFFLGFSPERIDPGNPEFTTTTIPKVVSGVTPACRQAIQLLYGQVIRKVVPVSSTRVAEMVKLLENTFRSVNIGLVNELALMCHRMGVDVWEVIDAAKSKPFGFMPFYPGPGLGGHCLAGEEWVVVKNGSQIETLTLEELVSLLQGKETRTLRHRGVTYLRPHDLEVLSFDLEKRRVCFQPLQWVSVRDYDGPMIRLRTGDGRFLTVTDRHPMVIQNGSLKLKVASDLVEKDELPVIRSMPEGMGASSVDLVEYCRGKPFPHIDRVKRMPTKSFLAHGDYSTVKVSETERINGTRKVYSVEVSKTHTFVTSYGLIVHNCIPIDPLYLSWKAKVHGFEPRFIELSSQINASMPGYVVQRVIQALNGQGRALKGARVLILGVAYKRDVGDIRESPALEILQHLKKGGALVEYHDPFIPRLSTNGSGYRSVPLTQRNVARAHCVVVVTDHQSVDYPFLLRHARQVLDTRNVLRKFHLNSRKVIRL